MGGLMVTELKLLQPNSTEPLLTLKFPTPNLELMRARAESDQKMFNMVALIALITGLCLLMSIVLLYLFKQRLRAKKLSKLKLIAHEHNRVVLSGIQSSEIMMPPSYEGSRKKDYQESLIKEQSSEKKQKNSRRSDDGEEVKVDLDLHQTEGHD